MAGTVIVGRIAVKVIPDTSDFGKDLERKLDVIEKTVDPLEVEVKLDDDRIAAQFKKAQARLEREAAKDPIEIDVDLASKAAQTAAKRMHDKLDDLIGDIKVDVDLDDALDGLDQLKDRTIQVEVDGSAVAVADRLQKALGAAANEARQLDAMTERTAQNIEVLTDGAEEQNKIIRRGKDTLRLARDLYKIQNSVIKENTKLAKEVAADAKRRLAIEKSITDAQDRQAASFKAIIDGAREAAQQQIRLEKSIVASADELEKQARNAELAADASQRLQHEIDKIKFSEDFERQMEKTDALLDEINDEIQELSALEDIDLILEVQNMTATERKIQALREQMESLRLTLTPELTDEDRAKVVRKIAALADQLEDELDNLEAEIEPSVGQLFYRRVQAQLAWLSRTRIVTLVPVVSAKAASAAATALAALSGARLQGKVVEDLFDAFKDLDKNLPKIGLLGEGIAGISGWALSASANLFSMSKELAQIGPIALGLPGIFAGMAIGITVLITALADFNERVPEVAEAWKALKPVIQDNFWAQAEGPMRRLTEELMPQLTEGLAKTATQMGGLFGQFGEDLVKELTGTKALDQMFQDLADSIEILKDGTGDFASIIRVLGEVGAKLLPRMSRYFVDISSTFEEFLTKAEADGSLDEWIDRAILRMRELGEVIGNFGGILTGLATAANEAGGSTLREWADDLQAIEDKVKSKAFQQDLVKVLRAADQAMTNMAERSGPGINKFFASFDDTLSTILPLVGDTIGTMIGTVAEALSRPAFQQGIQDFFQGIHDAVDALAPAMGPVSDALGSLLSLGGKMAESFSPALADVLTILADAVVVLAPYLERAVEALSGPLEGLLEELAGPIDKIAKAAGPAIEKVAEGVGALVKEITPSVGDAAEQIANFLTETFAEVDAEDMIRLGEALGRVITAVLDLVAAMDGGQVGKDFAAMFDSEEDAAWLNGIADAIAFVAEKVGLLDAELTKSGEAGGIGSDQWFADTPERVKTNWGLMVEAMKADWTGLWTFLDEASINFDAWVAENITTPLSNAWASFKESGWFSNEWFAQIGRDIVSGLTGGFTEKWSEIPEYITGAFGRLVTAVKELLGIHSPSTVFADIGRNIVRGLIAGVGELIGDAVAKVTDLVARMRAKFDGAKDWLVNRGREFVAGLRSGISDTASTVTTRVGELITAMRDRFSSAATWLVSRGRDFVAGLRRGIGEAAASVRTAASNLRQTIVNGVGDTFGLLISAGRQAAAGMASGIRDGAESVMGAARNLADRVSSTVRNALDIRSPSHVMAAIGAYVALGLAKGIEDREAEAAWAAERMADKVIGIASMIPHMMGDFGSMLGNDLVGGILDQIPLVERAAKSLIDALSGHDFKAEIELGIGVAKGLAKDVERSMRKPGDNDGPAPAAAPAKTVNFNYEIHNPISEPASVTTTRALRESQDQTGETP